MDVEAHSGVGDVPSTRRRRQHPQLSSLSSQFTTPTKSDSCVDGLRQQHGNAKPFKSPRRKWLAAVLAVRTGTCVTCGGIGCLCKMTASATIFHQYFYKFYKFYYSRPYFLQQCCGDNVCGHSVTSDMRCHRKTLTYIISN